MNTVGTPWLDCHWWRPRTREYEFAGVGVFVAEGDSRFLTRTLTAYGYRRNQLGADLRRRLPACLADSR